VWREEIRRQGKDDIHEINIVMAQIWCSGVRAGHFEVILMNLFHTRACKSFWGYQKRRAVILFHYFLFSHSSR
jgi:hypothetical protein